MASLVGQQLKDTYDSLLKTSDNDALGGTYKEITDGSGNGSNLYLGTGGNVGIGGVPSNNSGYSTLTLNSTSNGGVLEFERSGTRDALIYQESGGSNLIIQSESTKGLKFNTSGSNTAITIDSSQNVGIGETDPDSKLHLKSASAGLLELERTSVGAYRLAISLSDAFSIFDVAGNSDRLVIDSSGNVGIGTQTPDAIIETSAGVNGNTVGALLTNTNGAGTADSVSLNFGLGRSADSAIFKIEAIKLLKEQQWTGTPSTINGSLVFSTISNETTAERMRIHSTGDISFRDTSNNEAFYWDASATRLGIGTNTPSAPLTVQGGTISSPSIQLKGGSAGNDNSSIHSLYSLKIKADSSESIAGRTISFDVGSTTAMTLDSSGLVGIGATTVDDNLHVVGTSTKIQEAGQTGITMKFNHGNNASVNSDINIANIKSFVSSGSTGSEGGGLTFETKPTTGSVIERMRIDANGRLLVGTNGTVLNSFQGLAQRACFSATGDTMTVAVGTSTGAYTGIHIDRTSSNGKAISFERGNTDVGSISVTTTATAYNTSSDYRLKENVVELTGALDRVDQLNPSRFNFIADADTTVDGFLAHEVADVVPEAITGEKDATEEYEVTPAVLDDEGNVIEEAVMGTRPLYQGIDQSKLVPLLVGAIQELRAEIEQLKNQ